MKRLRLFTGMWLALLVAAAGPPAASADEPKLNLKACAAEPDDKRRLACYDAEVARLSGSAPVAESDDSAEVSSAESRKEGQQSGNAAANFGMTPALARSMKGKDEGGSEVPDSIAAIVTRIDEQPYGERIVYLDNGQVWEETSRNRTLRLSVGDDITVKSAAFGSYKLIGPGGKRFTRVQRIR